MRRVIRETQITVHPPNGVGEGPSARDDQQTRSSRGVANDREDGFELPRMGEKTSAELDDYVDGTGSGLWALGSRGL